MTQPASHGPTGHLRAAIARARQPLALALTLIALAGCGSGGGEAPPVTPPPSGSATVGGAAQTETVTVRSAQGVQVVVPPGAAAEPVTVRIAADSTGAPPLPDGLRAQGSMFAITPHGAQFAEPVTVRIPAPTVTPAANERLMLAKADPNGQWQLIDTGPPVDGHLVAQVQSFSFFLPVLVVYQTTAPQPLRLSALAVECVTPDCRNLPPDGSTVRVTVRTTGSALPLACDGRTSRIEVLIVWPNFSLRRSLPIGGGTVETEVAFRPRDPGGINPARGDAVGIFPDIICSAGQFEFVTRGGVYAAVYFAHFNWPQSTNPQPRVVSLTLPDVVAGQSAEVQTLTYGGAHRRPFVLNRDATATITAPSPGNQATIEWQRSDDGGGSWRTVATSFQSDAERRPTVFPEDWAYWRSRHRFEVDPRATGDIRFRARACIEMQVADGPTATRTEQRCDTSATAIARVLQQATAPGFTTLPRSQLVLNGETANFSAVADGLPAPTLQWQTRPANSVGVWTDVPGATNPGFTTRVLTLADNGTQYRVVATNAGGSNASPPVTVSVSDTAVAPVITSELSAIRALRGGDATFAVGVRGTEPLSYEWRVNGNVVPAQNGPQLNLQSVQGDGTVQVRVSNAAGTASSRTVALQVFDREIPILPPVIDSGPVATGGLEGATVSLAVQARGGPLSYRWQRNGVDLPNAPDAPVLVLSNLTSAAEGDYRVVVSNARGSVTSAAAALTVRPAGGLRAAPAIDVQPTGLTLDPGQTATFAVGVSGSGPLSFQWLRDGVPISGATSAVLTLGAITAADAANYTVRVTNSEGSVTSAAAGLVVVPAPGAPQFTFEQGMLEAVVGDSPRIEMRVVGTPAPRCLWLRNGVPIANAADCTGLNLANVQLADSGAVFTIVAYSAGGAAVGGPTVLTVRAPAAPTVNTQPTDQVATAVPPSTFRSARFTAGYDGVPQPLPNWRINGRLLGPNLLDTFDDGTCRLAYDIWGPALFLTLIGPGCDGATIQGVGTNRFGSVSTDVVRLTFASSLPAPELTTQPQNVTVTAGQPATFTAVVANAPFVQWERNGQPIAGATSQSYAIGATSTADSAATFRLLACTEPGPSGRCVYSDTVVLTVNPAATPPQITGESGPQRFTAGGSALFWVSGTGTQPITEAWRINGVELPVTVQPLPLPSALAPCTANYTYVSGLTLTNIAAACSGAVLVARATNPAGSLDSNPMSLTLVSAPVITSFTSNGPRDEGQTVTASVTATGSNLTYQWLLSFDIGSTGIAIAGATGASYTTPPMTQGYSAAALRVRVCSGPQPAEIVEDPSCTFSNLEAPLGQTFEVGAAGVCYGGPNGWCVRSPSPQPNDLRALVLPDPSNSPTAPVVAVGFGTVMSSTDFGVSWTTRFPNPRLDFRGLARTADGSRLVAAVAANNASQTTGGLYTSDDGGATWALATGVGTQDFVNDVALASSGSGVAVGSGLWRSAANGTGWTPVVTAAQFLPESLTRVVIQGNVALAVSDAGGILRSTDGGVNWTRVYSDNGARRLVDAALDAFGLAVVVIDNANQVLVSRDAGQSWSLRTLPFGNARGVGLQAQDQAVVLSATGDGAFSTDGGQTWTLATAAANRTSDADWRIAYTSSGNGLAVGKFGALRRTSSLDRFSGIGGGDADARIDAIEAAPDGTLLMVRGGLIGRSTDNGSTWTGFGQPGTSLSWVGNGTAFAALLSGNATKLLRSDDAGQTFTEQWDQSNDMIYGLSMINTGVGVLIGTRGGQPAVFRTTNGRFWDSIGALPAGFEPRSVLALNPGPFADPNSAVVLVGSGDGRVLRTTNGGLSWFELNPGIGAAVNQIRPIDASGVIAAADNGLWQSLDAGQNWTRVFDSTPYGSMTSVAVDASGRCVATGVVGVVDCSSFSIIDLPFNGLLRATAWGSGNTVLAGGLGGALLINRNGGLPARAAPDRRQRLGTTRTASYPMPLARIAAPPAARGALRPATAPTAAAARPAAPALRDPRDPRNPRAVLLPRTVPNARKATLPPLPPVVVGPLRRHVDVVPAGRPDAAGVRRR